MSLLEILLIAIGLSMDAFAVAVCIGLTMSKVTVKKSLIIGLYFGVFQAVMPIIGYMLAARLADKIAAFDHWIAFTLLCFIGGKMIIESFKKEDRCETEEKSLGFTEMLPLAVATSIDALIVGVSFAFLKVSIVPTAISIGIITLVLSMVGVKIGNIFGERFKSNAELLGGIILILIGFKVLFEHLGIIGF